MILFVVDSSVALKWFLEEEDYADSARLLLDDEYELIAPDLFWPECGNILWKKVQRNELTADKASLIRKGIEQQPITIFPSSLIVEPAIEIAFDTGASVYDCCYLALAMLYDCKMATADRKLMSALLYTKYSRHVLWIANLS